MVDPMADPVFEPGDKVTPRYTRGYDISMGKSYEVISYEPRDPQPTFTWPAYVCVADNSGREVKAHAFRFTKVES